MRFTSHCHTLPTDYTSIFLTHCFKNFKPANKPSGIRILQNILWIITIHFLSQHSEMCKLVVRVLKWIQLWFMVLSWQCWAEVLWRKPNICSNPDNSSNKNLNSVKNITYILYRLTWLQSIPPYCILTICERCMWHFQPTPLNRQKNPKRNEELTGKWNLKSPFSVGHHFESWVIFVLVFSSKSIPDSTPKRVWRETHRDHKHSCPIYIHKCRCCSDTKQRSAEYCS